MANAARRKLLVLDGQGVVINAPVGRFLAEFAVHNSLSVAEIEQRWESRVRERAWRGLIDDTTLWGELAGRKVDASVTRQSLDANYTPGPALPYLAEWSQSAELWLLSNHRSHWLIPKLETLGVSNVFDRVLISDRTGFMKPEAESFLPVCRAREAAQQVLFVDDQLHNVLAAKALGIPSLLATPDMHWLERVIEWIDCDHAVVRGLPGFACG